ncbi:MAG: hypothetical protein LQ345_007452 [Seirophora villosa]|nr:MAG: hypothetical protein LQ345_007452 [Seirophora villosa]
MPPQSAQTARKTVNGAEQESLVSWPDWTKTREETIDEISKQGLSTDPQDLTTLITNIMRTSDTGAKNLLAEKNERLRVLDELNESRKVTIKTLQEQASANDGLLAEKDAALNRMKASFAEMYSKTQGLASNARTVEAAQEKAEASATAAIDVRDARIRDLDVAAAERNNKIRSLEAKVAALRHANGNKAETIANLERFARDTIKAKDEEVADLKTDHDRVLVGTREQLETVRANCSRLIANLQANTNQVDVPETLADEGEISRTELTRTSFGKRPHKRSSTSTNPSPRKEPSKRVRQSAYWRMHDNLLGSGNSSPQSIDQSSLPRQTSFLRPTRLIAPELQTNRLDSGSAQRSNLPEFSLSLQTPIGLGSPRQSPVRQAENEEEEVAGPSNAQLTIPDNLAGIWNQLKLDETHGRIDEAQLLGLMQSSQTRPKPKARPYHLLKDCADKTANGVHICFTSKLRAKGGGDFEEGGVDHPCKICGDKLVCLRVKWFDHGARNDENAVKRWVLEPR